MLRDRRMRYAVVTTKLLLFAAIRYLLKMTQQSMLQI